MTVDTSNDGRDMTAARLSGFLFINAIAFLFLGEALYRPYLNPLDFDGLAANENKFLLGVLVEWIASVPLILMIPVLLFPILARHSVRAAVAYLALRALEVGLLTVADTTKLTMVDLATWTDRALAESVGTARLAEAAWIDSAGLVYNLVFGASALVLFGTLLAAQLVPRIIAAWGLFATVVLMVGAVAYVFGLIPASAGPIVWGPIALAEVALALWLIIKGVDLRR